MSFSILYSVLLYKLWHNAKARASGGTADAVVSKTSEETRVGSNPTSRTIEFKELPDMAALLVFPARMGFKPELSQQNHSKFCVKQVYTRKQALF